ncbi:MAG: hypothetical protein ACJA1E_001530 [Paracoccaceae bacterium]|jgi:hypothetical protein
MQGSGATHRGAGFRQKEQTGFAALVARGVAKPAKAGIIHKNETTSADKARSVRRIIGTPTSIIAPQRSLKNKAWIRVA